MILALFCFLKFSKLELCWNYQVKLVLLFWFSADLQVPGCISSVGDIKETNRTSDGNALTKHFQFFLHTKESFWRRVCFSPQKRRILKKILSKNEGLYFNEVYAGKDNNYITLGSSSSIELTDLVFKRPRFTVFIYLKVICLFVCLFVFLI